MSVMWVIVLAIVFSVAFLVSKLRSRDSSVRARKHAIEAGVEVATVNRQIPVTGGTGFKVKYELIDGECQCYSIRHQCESAQSWKLLQRFDNELEEADYWKFEGTSEPSRELETALVAFKHDFDEDFYEIEVKNAKVHIYWEEWGGVQIVNQLVDYLNRFASIRS